VKTPDLTLYLVTDRPAVYPRGLLAGVEAALEGGVGVVQYRFSDGTRREHYETACALRDLLRVHGVPLIINDSVDLALAVDADGVHVGQTDLPVDVARRLIGRDRMLGLSITQPAQLAQVDPTLVDYLGVGPVFPTGSKADAAPALGLDELRRIVAASPLPVVAIGGINLERASTVFATGVAGIAVVAALSLAGDPTTAARALRAARAGGRG
jgi:thiamine-phosphate pyrophosphorylase